MTEGMAPHTVAGVLTLAGPQATRVDIHHPNTDEAAVTVAIGHSALYLHTPAAAARIGELWETARQHSRHLPVAIRTRLPAQYSKPHHVEASLVVHTRGTPAGAVRLNKQPGQTTFLHVQIGGLSFQLHDQRALQSCVAAFLRASELGIDHLTPADKRLQPPLGQEPQLSGRRGDRLERVYDENAEVQLLALQLGDDALAKAQLAMAAVRETLQRLEPVKRAAVMFNPPSENTSPPNRRGPEPPPRQRTNEGGAAANIAASKHGSPESPRRTR